MDVLRPGCESPYWQEAGDAPAGGAPVVPEAGLHTLGAGATARASGFGAPIWQ